MPKPVLPDLIVPLEPTVPPPLLRLLHLIPPALPRRQRQHLRVQLIVQLQTSVRHGLARVVRRPPLVQRPLGQRLVARRVFKRLIHAPDMVHRVRRNNQRPMKRLPYIRHVLPVLCLDQQLEVLFPQPAASAVPPDVLERKLQARPNLRLVVLARRLDVVNVQPVQVHVQADEKTATKQGLDGLGRARIDFKLAELTEIRRGCGELERDRLIRFTHRRHALRTVRIGVRCRIN